MRTLITGATGLIGQRLIKHIDHPVVLSRNASRARKKLGVSDAFSWNPTTGTPPQKALEGVDVVINLAGEPVAGGRWTASKKKRIYDSRIHGLRNLLDGFSTMQVKPRVLVSASAIGYYGERGDEILVEDSVGGVGFLAKVSRDWEHEALLAVALGVRVVCIRIGIVLCKSGGALGQMLPVFKMGLGGKLGSGEQWMSWIHIDDAVGLILHAVKDNNLHGAINATAPNPVTNAEFTRTLGHALRRPAFLPAPKFGLKMAFGEMSDVIMASHRVIPKRAIDMGYPFRHSTLEGALSSFFQPKSSS